MEGESKITLHLGMTPDGEPKVVVEGEDGNVSSQVVGSGPMTRGRVYGEEIVPGKRIVYATGVTEEAQKKLDEELRAEGAKRVGGDSPDIGRPTYGWTRRFGDRYDSIFGHGEPKN